MRARYENPVKAVAVYFILTRLLWSLQGKRGYKDTKKAVCKSLFYAVLNAASCDDDIINAIYLIQKP